MWEEEWDIEKCDLSKKLRRKYGNGHGEGTSRSVAAERCYNQ